MLNKILLFSVIISFVLIQGCVAPGSAIGNLKIQGEIYTNLGSPISGRELEFILPASYGLGGLDLVLNKPEDFGHKDQRFTVITDHEGKFEYDFGPQGYHMGCWLLPPVGCFPKRPPAPFLLVRFPENLNEYYAIQIWDGQFNIYTFTGEEVKLADSQLEAFTAYDIAGENPDWPETIGVIELKIKPK